MCADGWVQGNGWKKVGRRTDGHERAWMRGRFLQTVRVKGKLGNGWGEGPVGMSARGCADVCGRCGCKEKVGNGSVDARTFADGVCVQGKGWKWVV